MHGQVVQCCLPWQLLKLIPFAKCPAMCSLTIHNLCAAFSGAIRTKKSSFPNRYMRLLGIFRRLSSSASSYEELIYPVSRELFRVFFSTTYLFHPPSYIILEWKLYFWKLVYHRKEGTLSLSFVWPPKNNTTHSFTSQWL